MNGVQIVKAEVFGAIIPYIRALAKKYGSRHPEDDCQDVCVAALRHPIVFQDERCARAWFRTVTRRRVAEQFRKSSRFPELASSETLEAAPGRGWFPNTNIVSELLGALKPIDREIIQAHDLNGEAERDFAKRKGISNDAAKKRLLRARAALRALIDDGNYG